MSLINIRNTGEQEGYSWRCLILDWLENDHEHLGNDV